MLLIRRFEEKAGEAYSLGKIGGFCHLYIGQEAVAVGAIAALRRDDYITCVLPRARPRAGARHERRARVMAELFGKATGLLAAARAARCTSSTPRSASWAGTASSAATSRSPTGMAFAVKYRGDDQVARLLLRRGGGEQRRLPRGAQHGGALEAARPSSSARTTATGWARRSSARSAIYDVSERACSYDMASEVVDGQDVLVVYARRWSARSQRARDRASTPRCSRSAPTASWATRCPTRSTGTTAPRKRSRSTGSATRSRAGRTG